MRYKGFAHNLTLRSPDAICAGQRAVIPQFHKLAMTVNPSAQRVDGASSVSFLVQAGQSLASTVTSVAGSQLVQSHSMVRYSASSLSYPEREL